MIRKCDVSKWQIQFMLMFVSLMVLVILMYWASTTTNTVSMPSMSSSINLECDCERSDKEITKNVHHITTEEVPTRSAIKAYPPDEKCVKRLPQAIIVGIQKSGTTTLLKFLNDHPQIAACLNPAETKYFSMYYTRPLSWYKNLMPCSYSNQITMEKSPPYFYRRYCAEKIRKMDPNTKIIITVKEPIERAISMYAMLKEYKQVHGLSFEDYVSNSNRTKIKTQKTMIQFSNYPKHMKYWLDNFDMNQILIVDGQKFITDPSSELMKVERFLQIQSYFTAERFVFNATKGKHCLLKSGVQQCMESKKGRAHPEISPDVIQLLQKYFKPLNEKFFEMIGRRFEWGY